MNRINTGDSCHYRAYDGRAVVACRGWWFHASVEYVGLQAVALDDKVPAKDAAQEGYEMADIGRGRMCKSRLR